MGIDTYGHQVHRPRWFSRGNEEKPEWALTHPQTGLKSYMMKCGNEEKPEWALTQDSIHLSAFSPNAWK